MRASDPSISDVSANPPSGRKANARVKKAFDAIVKLRFCESKKCKFEKERTMPRLKSKPKSDWRMITGAGIKNLCKRLWKTVHPLLITDGSIQLTYYPAGSR